MVEFTLAESIKAQKAMRDSLGLQEERFPLPAFVGMVSDEIEQLRGAGRSDQEIADMVFQATGKRLEASDIARHYAGPDDRRPG